MVNRFEYRYALPAGFSVADLPEDAAGEVPEASFAVRYRVDGGALVVSGQVVLRASRVSPERYPAFRTLMASLDRAFARRVRLAPAPVAAGEAK